VPPTGARVPQPPRSTFPVEGRARVRSAAADEGVHSELTAKSRLGVEQRRLAPNVPLQPVKLAAVEDAEKFGDRVHHAPWVLPTRRHARDTRMVFRARATAPLCSPALMSDLGRKQTQVAAVQLGKTGFWLSGAAPAGPGKTDRTPPARTGPPNRKSQRFDL
jgi:hypothetical protein